MIEKKIMEGRLRSGGLSAVWFSRKGCGVCTALYPRIEALVRDLELFQWIPVDTDENPEISGQHLVFSVPTLLIFMRGKEIRRWNRRFIMDELRAELERIAEADAGSG